MSGRIATLLNSGLKLLEGQLDTPRVFYKNGSYPCVVSTENRGTIMEIGGIVYAVLLTAIIRQSALPDAIVEGGEVSVDWNGHTDVIGSIFKTPVRLVATDNIDLSTFTTGDTLDGIATDEGDRVLLTGQLDAKENGIYRVGILLTRTSDCDASDDFIAWFRVNVNAGTHTGEQWMLNTVPPVALGTDGILFTQLATDDALSGTPTTPFSGRQIGRRNRLYRIVAVREDSARSHWSLDLADFNS